ncbi:MAG: hypothetical protein KatS3mg105_1402 [Gemmatales bacterium]|nr:MAG: hypothetical protein KatS3mg105_1402 [Gemmatales bacterium]
MRRPVIVEDVILFDAQKQTHEPVETFGRSAVDDANSGIGRFELDTDFVHAFEFEAKDGVRGRRVFDFAEIVDGDFEGGFGLMEKCAQVVVAFDLEFGKLCVGTTSFYPNGPEALLNIVGLRLGIKFRVARAFAIAIGIESPAVVFAPEPVFFDRSQAQRHAPVRADVIESADLLVGGAE